MNLKNKPLITKRKVIAFLLMITLLTSAFYVLTASNGSGATYITSGSFQGDYSYLVYKNATHSFMKNGTTGTVDAEGTDDDEIISWAYGNLTSGRTSKETVILKGNFTINTILDVPDNTILDMLQAEISTTSNIQLIKVDTGINVDLLGGFLHGNGLSNNKVWITDSTDVTIQGMRVEECGSHVIYIENSDRVTVQTSTLNNSNSIGVFIFESNYCDILNNDINVQRTGVQVGASDELSIGNLIDGNDIQGWTANTNYHAVYVSSYNASYPYGGVQTDIVNNRIHDDGTGMGVAIAFRGWGGTIANNQIWNVENTGIQIVANQAGDYVASVSVTGNSLNGTGVDNGIELLSTTSNVTLCSITANTIRYFARGIVVNGIGSYNSTYNTVTANTVDNCATNGIKLASNSDNNSVGFNVITNSGTNLDDGVNNTVEHNVGW